MHAWREQLRVRACRRSAVVSRTALLLALSLGSANEAEAMQQDVPNDAALRQYDVFLAAGLGGLRGGEGRQVFGGPGALGLGFERRVSASGSWRAEATLIGTFGELVPPGRPERPAVTVNHAGVAVGYRRYSERSRFVGAGLGVAAITLCEVDPELNLFDPESGIVRCKDFEEVLIRAGSVVPFATATIGGIAGRITLGLRMDAGLMPSARSENGALYLTNVGILGEYRFGPGRRRSRLTTATIPRGAGTRR